MKPLQIFTMLFFMSLIFISCNNDDNGDLASDSEGQIEDTEELTETELSIFNEETKRYEFTMMEMLASYQGGAYLSAALTQEGLENNTQGFYLLLPNFEGLGTYNCDVLVIRDDFGYTNLVLENPDIQAEITEFNGDGELLKGTASGTFTDSDGATKTVSLSFEVPYFDETN